ncbi:hypothetical protein C8J57DRAFT_1505328 [Mycena rebaudengoi]|nr:hypothetical protein C8J57DRAFT_1505328 [Mycena rebaudengoi]
MLSTETALECFYSAHDTMRYTIRIMYVYFLAVHSSVMESAASLLRADVLLDAFLRSSVKLPISCLDLPTAIDPRSSYALCPSSSTTRSIQLSFTSALAPTTRTPFAAALSEVLVALLTPTTSFENPADEQDDVERQEGDTTSTGPSWVDLSLLLHRHTPQLLPPCPSTTDDDSVRTTGLANPRDVPTPLPATDDTVFAATTMTPALCRSSATSLDPGPCRYT